MKKHLEEFATRDKHQIIRNFQDYLPDPDLILRQQGKGSEIYRKLELDPHLAAVKQQRIMQVTAMDWGIYNGVFELSPSVEGKPKSRTQSKEDRELKELLTQLDIYGYTEQALEALFYGYSVTEVIWKQEGGKIIPAELRQKPQEWFVFGDKGELRMRTSLSGLQSAEVPEYKFLVTRHKATYNNPYGEKLFAKVFWPVTLKKDAIVFWSYMAEKYGMPYLVGRVNRNTPAEEREKFLDALSSMRRDAVAVIDDDETITTLDVSSRSGSSDLYHTFINYQNNEISKAILTVTLTTDVQEHGTYAASQTHKEILDRIALSDRKLAEKGVNELMGWMRMVNG